ncbi:unnamed protein product [marine sediment metagenome]|uniref:Uncharacterized protein n=1 Tax=marine sediment metagenome TaxID=412755 RepID=X1FVT3_9ZZZZ
MTEITIKGDIATVHANEGTLETFLDHWSSSGFLASLIEKDNIFAIGKIFYDLNKVSFDRIREVADKIDRKEMECPVCQRLVKEKPSTGNNGEGEMPAKEEPVVKEEPQPVLKETPEPKEKVAKPAPELELDEVEIQELERERAIQKIVSAMDEILLMKMMR